MEFSELPYDIKEEIGKWCDTRRAIGLTPGKLSSLDATTSSLISKALMDHRWIKDVWNYDSMTGFSGVSWHPVGVSGVLKMGWRASRIAMASAVKAL